MVAWPWIFAGGSALIAGAVILRNAKAATPATSKPPATDVCDALAPLGPQAVLQCKAAKEALNIVKELIPQSADSTNTGLNGAAVEVVHPGARLGSMIVDGKKQLLPTKAPHTTRYANGCVPFPDHPDWSKCAPGTKSMITTVSNDQSSYWHYTNKSPAGLMSGDPLRDLLTFKFTGKFLNGAPYAAPFPLPVPAGATPWFYRGQPMVCPAGTEIRGIDHRPGAPPCIGVYTGTVPPPVAGTRTGTGGDFRTDPPK